MRVMTAPQIRAAERLAIQSGISEEQLMQAAGEACTRMIAKTFPMDQVRRIVVVCGKGKNGGDGFVIARRLHLGGHTVHLILSEGEPGSGLPRKMFLRAMDSQVPVTAFSKEPEQAFCEIDQADLIVDCLFGVGFHGQPKESDARLFCRMNQSGAPVAAVDVPSGTDCETGAASDPCVQADLTIAISTYKMAHVLPPAASCCGKVVCVKIGIPEECLDQAGCDLYTVTGADAKRALPVRDSQSHKGNYGHLLQICGSYTMPGAAVLAARSAVHSGVGLLTCAFPKSAYPALTAQLTEPLFLPLSENEEKTLSIGALPKILDGMKSAAAILIGCGMGWNEDTEMILAQVLKEACCPVIVDADGINCLSAHIDILKAVQAPVILTPHPGEMARLTGRSVGEIQQNRLQAARAFTEQYPCTLVLKGAGTLIAQKGEAVFVNLTGNPGMAQGGCGDMLAGLLASLVAQGTPPFEAAKAAVYLHGKVGDSAARSLSQRGMTPTDMVELLPLLLLEYEQ